MAYDKELAQRIREIYVQKNIDFDEKVMFGDVGFMIGGNVACGLIGNEL